MPYRLAGGLMRKMQQNGWMPELARFACIQCFMALNFENVLQVIVTSFLFPGAKFSLDRLKAISAIVGKDKLVVDVRYSRISYSEHHF